VPAEIAGNLNIKSNIEYMSLDEIKLELRDINVRLSEKGA